jgi:hypothetical protein
MCYQLVYLIFDFQSEATLKDAAAMGYALSQIVERGFYLADEGAGSPEAAWKMAIRKGQRSVWVNLEDDSRFALTVSLITNNWRRLYLSVDRTATAKPQHTGKLVRAGEAIYNTLKPDYGYGLVSLDTQYLDPPGDGDYTISTVYDYNFYSPRLVARLGEANVKAVTASRSVVFADAGILVELSPNPLGDRKPYTANYQAAAGILGAAKYQQGC